MVRHVHVDVVAQKLHPAVANSSSRCMLLTILNRPFSHSKVQFKELKPPKICKVRNAILRKNFSLEVRRRSRV